MPKFILAVILFLSLMNNQVLAGEGDKFIENRGTFFPETANGLMARSTETLKDQFLLSQSGVIVLDAIEQVTADAIVSNDSLRQRIGIRRGIEQLASNAKAEKVLNWQQLAEGGQIATLIVTSPSAAALRLAISVTSLPEEAECRFFGLSEGVPGKVYLVTGKQILDLLKLNQESEPNNPDVSLYWSPAVEGSSIGVEFYLPENIDSKKVDIAFPSLSHLAVTPYDTSEGDLNFQGYGDSDSCQNDATCYSGWLNMRKATAKMIFTDSGYSYICTGTLLNDKDPTTYIPYFISANHCIGSQVVASSLTTLWRYESASCNSSTISSSYAVKYGGAKLLWTKGLASSYVSSSMDTSFFKLLDTPPSGVYFAGWSTSMPSGTKTGVHHPQGDWKKISFGNPSGTYICWSTSSTNFSCSASSSGSFLGINWTNGGTEGGSSGSGIYHDNDHLIGDLTGGGGGNCAGSHSYYSTFKAAYAAGDLGKWLNVTPTSVTAPSLSSINALLLKPGTSSSDPCIDTISLAESKSGVWSSTCTSVHSSGSYAKYFTFSLGSTRSVQIDLTSSVDTYMYLLNGSGKYGSIIESNDDGGDGLNSRIIRTLSPGSYTIEATTFSSATTGAFGVSLN